MTFWNPQERDYKMFNTLAVIPVPDTMTLSFIVVAVLLLGAAAIYKNKRDQANEVNAKVEEEIAKRAARASARDD